MDQTETCPFCANEIKEEAVICHSCGSDLTFSALKKQPDRQLKKKFGLGLLEVLGVFIVASLLIYLSRFLPEGARQWHDWYFGVGRPCFFTPAKIIILLIVFCVLVSRLLRYRGK